jgi:hypothetical protein
MKTTNIICVSLILFCLFVSQSFASQRLLTQPDKVGYDLAIKKGKIDYSGSGESTKKILEFIIGNIGNTTSPKCSVVFKRGKLKLTKPVPALKPRKIYKVNFSFPHHAAPFTAIVMLKDRNLENNRVSGTE